MVIVVDVEVQKRVWNVNWQFPEFCSQPTLDPDLFDFECLSNFGFNSRKTKLEENAPKF